MGGGAQNRQNDPGDRTSGETIGAALDTDRLETCGDLRNRVHSSSHYPRIRTPANHGPDADHRNRDNEIPHIRTSPRIIREADRGGHGRDGGRNEQKMGPAGGPRYARAQDETLLRGRGGMGIYRACHARETHTCVVAERKRHAPRPPTQHPRL